MLMPRPRRDGTPPEKHPKFLISGFAMAFSFIGAGRLVDLMLRSLVENCPFRFSVVVDAMFLLVTACSILLMLWLAFLHMPLEEVALKSWRPPMGWRNFLRGLMGRRKDDDPDNGTDD